MFISDKDVSLALTNVSIGVTVDTSEYVATKIFPIVKVPNQTAKYWKYKRGDWYRSQAQVRGPGQETVGTSFRVESDDAYYCKIYGLHTDIDDVQRANVSDLFATDAEVTRNLQGQILLKRELEFLSKYFVPSAWANSATPAIKWDAANATILKDIRDAKRAIKRTTGMRANKLVIQEEVWDAIQESGELIDRIKGGATGATPATLSQEQVAGMLGLDEIVIAGAISNTAQPGLTDALDFAAGPHALLIHVPQNPGLMTPSAGYTFVWNELYGVGPEGERVLKIRMDEKRSDRIDAEANWDSKVLAQDLAYCLHDVLT
jgi:hypothetical protein